MALPGSRLAIPTLLAILGVSRILVPATLAAQEPPGESPAVAFGEVLEVRVVNVEVVVTDRQGTRVTGLQASDFQLYVDGKEAPLGYFTEVKGGVAVGAAEGEALGLPASLSRGSPVGTSYLVFVDEYYSYAADRDRVVDALLEQLPHLGAEDRMAIVAYDGRDLEMLSSWSQSHAQLERTLRRLRGRPAYGQQRSFERRSHDLQRRAAAGLFSRDAAGLDLEERQHLDEVSGQLERMALAVSSTLRGFGSPPGRKVMILLSGGWPFDPVDWVTDTVARPVLESAEFQGGQLFEPIVGTANLLGYTLYPVDVSGVQGKAIETRGIGDELGSPSGLSFVRENELHSTLRHLASETGGEALLDTDRRRPLEAPAADTRSYYWLGFTPSWRGDDERHTIEVRLRRPDLEVRSRSGFADLSRARQVSLVVESALLFGDPPSPLPLVARFGQPSKAGAGRLELPLTIGIPLDAVTLLPAPNGFVAQLELRVAVLDDRGGQNEIPVVPITLAMPERPEAGKFAKYETVVLLRKRTSKVVVALYDVASGTILSTSAELAL